MIVSDMAVAGHMVNKAARRCAFRYNVPEQDVPDLRQTGWLGIAAAKGKLDESKPHFAYMVARNYITREVWEQRGALKRGGWNRDAQLPIDETEQDTPLVDEGEREGTRRHEARQFARELLATAGLTELQVKLLRMVHWEDKPLAVAPVRYRIKIDVARAEYAAAIDTLRQAAASAAD